MTHFYNAEEHSHLLGIHEDMPNDEYHQKQPGISSSVVKTMLKSPHQTFSRHFAPNREHVTTPAMEFGTAAHALILEGMDGFNRDCALVPENINKRTKIGKEEWAEFEEANKGKVMVKAADFELLEKMRIAIHKHPTAGDILSEQACVEHSGFWADEATGLLCKFRPDWWVKSPAAVVDLKTCLDASEAGFQRVIGNFGYHLSAAWYLNGVLKTTGEDCKNFVFLAQEKAEETGFGVGVYVLSEEVVEASKNVNKILLGRLAECLHTGVWKGYQDDRLTEISLAPWDLKRIGL